MPYTLFQTPMPHPIDETAFQFHSQGQKHMLVISLYRGCCTCLVWKMEESISEVESLIGYDQKLLTEWILNHYNIQEPDLEQLL